MFRGILGCRLGIFFNLYRLIELPEEGAIYIETVRFSHINNFTFERKVPFILISRSGDS